MSDSSQLDTGRNKSIKKKGRNLDKKNKHAPSERTKEGSLRLERESEGAKRPKKKRTKPGLEIKTKRGGENRSCLVQQRGPWRGKKGSKKEEKKKTKRRKNG